MSAVCCCFLKLGTQSTSVYTLETFSDFPKATIYYLYYFRAMAITATNTTARSKRPLQLIGLLLQHMHCSHIVTYHALGFNFFFT